MRIVVCNGFPGGVVPQPNAAPQDPLDRFGSSMVLSLLSSAVTLSGSNVTGATDRSVSAANFTPNSTVTYLASDPCPGGKDTPSIVMGTTTSRLGNNTSFGGPLANPHWEYAVVQMNDWVNGKRIIGNAAGTNNNQAVVQSVGTPGIAGVNSSGGNSSYGGALGQWVLVMIQYSGGNAIATRTQDWVSIRGLKQAGVNMGGVTQRTGSSIGRGVGMKVKEWGAGLGVLTDADEDVINAHVEYWYGSDTVRPPINAATWAVQIEGQSNILAEGVTTSVGPGNTFTACMSLRWRTSLTADVNTFPDVLRRPRTRQVGAPDGKWGPELQMLLDLKAAGEDPAFVLKNAHGATNLLEAVSGTPGTMRRAHWAEFAGETGAIVKLFIVAERGTTDCTESINQATALVRWTAYYSALIDEAKAACPNLPNEGIHLLSHEIDTKMTSGAAFIAGVNAARVQALGVITSTYPGATTYDVLLSDLPLAADPHRTDSGINSVGARDAGIIAAAA